MSNEDLAWGAAGFLDGEGCFLCSPPYPRKDRPGKTPKRVTVSATQKDRGVLDRLQATLGGKVYGPYDRGGKGYQFQWMTTRTNEFFSIVEKLWPWMSEVKRAQATTARGKFEDPDFGH